MTYLWFENEETHKDSPGLIEWKMAEGISLDSLCGVDRTMV
jgi:hypothetical protein